MSEPAPSSGSFERGLEGSKVGHRLRAERERLGIGLRELARRVGVSPSLVSQIELDRVNPSVSTLYAIVTELGMTMSDVFGERPEERVVQRGDGLAERPETRPVINLASGVRWERLTHERDPDVEFLYVVYPVGAASCPEDALMTHGGREYGYVTSGTLGVQVGFEVYELGPGGSIAFDSSSPHRLWAVGGEPVHAIWVVIGREADPRTTRCRRRARFRTSSACRRFSLAGLEAADAGPARTQAAEKLGALVEHERQQDQHADGDLGVLRRLVEQRQDVVDQREEERREQRADERALPAGERCAAEDGCGDALEPEVADDRRADLDLGREVEAGERRHHRADDEREE